MEALDGNAIAGDLFEYFGGEMTTATGSCRHCGARAKIAELRVYTKAPGRVARCRSCGSVVMVVSKIGATIRLDLEGFALD